MYGCQDKTKIVFIVPKKVTVELKVELFMYGAMQAIDSCPTHSSECPVVLSGVGS